MRSLLEADLVDELNLMIEPIVLGGGKSIFPTDGAARRFELESAATAANGRADLPVPADAPQAGSPGRRCVHAAGGRARPDRGHDLARAAIAAWDRRIGGQMVECCGAGRWPPPDRRRSRTPRNAQPRRDRHRGDPAPQARRRCAPRPPGTRRSPMRRWPTCSGTPVSLQIDSPRRHPSTSTATVPLRHEGAGWRHPGSSSVDDGTAVARDGECRDVPRGAAGDGSADERDRPVGAQVDTNERARARRVDRRAPSRYPVSELEQPATSGEANCRCVRCHVRHDITGTHAG